MIIKMKWRLEIKKIILVWVWGILIASRAGASNSLDVPWSWYATRSAAFLSFGLLFLSIFFGLAIRISAIQRSLTRINVFSVHCWLSLQALAFSFIHAATLLFDHYLKFSLADIFIPFVSSFEKFPMALGIISFYLMVALVVSSYFRQRLSFVSWRMIHYLNPILYFLGLIHAMAIGTDFQHPFVRGIFIAATIVLVFLALFNVLIRLRLIGKSDSSSDICFKK